MAESIGRNLPPHDETAVAVLRKAGGDPSAVTAQVNDLGGTGDVPDVHAPGPRLRIRRNHFYVWLAGLPLCVRLIGLIAGWMNIST